MRPERLSKAQAVRVGEALTQAGGAEQRFSAIASALAEVGYEEIASPGVSAELAEGYRSWMATRRASGDERLVEEMEELAAWLIEMRRLP